MLVGSCFILWADGTEAAAPRSAIKAPQRAAQHQPHPAARKRHLVRPTPTGRSLLKACRPTRGCGDQWALSRAVVDCASADESAYERSTKEEEPEQQEKVQEEEGEEEETLHEGKGESTKEEHLSRRRRSMAVFSLRSTVKVSVLRRRCGAKRARPI